VREVVIRIQSSSFSNIADGMLHKRQVKAFLRHSLAIWWSSF
jgi:hypothetical protein